MWRIVSLKSLICLVFIILGLTLVIISRSQSGPALNKYASLGLRQSEFSKEDDMHYYHNDHEEAQSPKAKGPLPVVKKEAGDYPFDDDFGNEKEPTNNNNDFDPLSGPGEDRVIAVKSSTGKPSEGAKGQHQTFLMDQVTCDVNHGKYSVDCMKDAGNEVYVPFSFLHKYFEIYGKMSETDPDTFVWLHSQAKIFRPKGPYDPKGVFTYFENYNVEVRDRVKCVSGSEGVPVSTQWDVNGYYYPIQIAQFGLSHYSKYVVEGEPSRVRIEDADSARSAKWVLAQPSDLKIVPDPNSSSNKVIEISPSRKGEDSAVKLPLATAKPHLLVLSLDLRLKKTGRASGGDDYFGGGERDGTQNITLTLTVRYESQVFYLHYTTSDFFILAKNNHIYHGLGRLADTGWRHVIRDLGVDVQKGAGLGTSKKKAQKIPRSKLSVESLSILNLNSAGAPVLLDNITLASNEHLAQFFQAVDWFAKSQDAQGGWPIPVPRKFNQASNFYPVLRAGWYSAMGQGHGLSLLSRAYSRTQDPKYAEACRRALGTIFEVSGEGNRGVRARFLDRFTWYEEYPTIPSSFVLNGFMYALLGLHDVSALRVPGAAQKAGDLYKDGMASLVHMLPLYDTGSGTMYDLRHFTVPGIPPNLARLDYHVTHINQLLTFATISEDPIFPALAERWIKYTLGDRASHN